MASELMCVNDELRKLKAEYDPSVNDLADAPVKIEQLEEISEEPLENSDAKIQKVSYTTLELVRDFNENKTKRVEEETKNQEIASLEHRLVEKDEEIERLKHEWNEEMIRIDRYRMDVYMKKILSLEAEVTELKQNLEVRDQEKTKVVEILLEYDQEIDSLEQIIVALKQNSAMKSQEIELLKQSFISKPEAEHFLRQELDKRDKVSASVVGKIDTIDQGVKTTVEKTNTLEQAFQSETKALKVLTQDLLTKTKITQDLESSSDVSDLHQEIGKLYMKLQISKNQENKRILDFKDDIEKLEGTLKTRDQELEQMDLKYKEKEAEHWECIEERQTLLLKIKQLEEKKEKGHVTNDHVKINESLNSNLVKPSGLSQLSYSQFKF